MNKKNEKTDNKSEIKKTETKKQSTFKKKKKIKKKYYFWNCIRLLNIQ